MILKYSMKYFNIPDLKYIYHIQKLRIICLESIKFEL